MATTTLPGGQIVPSFFNFLPPSQTGQIVPSVGSTGPKPAQVTSVRDVVRPGLPGSSAPSAPKPGLGWLSNLVKGGIVTGLATPNVMGDATVTGAQARLPFQNYDDLTQEQRDQYIAMWNNGGEPITPIPGMSRLSNEPVTLTQPTVPSSTPPRTAQAPTTLPPQANLMDGRPSAPPVPTMTVNVDNGSATVPMGLAAQTLRGFNQPSPNAPQGPLTGPLTTLGGAPLQGYLEGRGGAGATTLDAQGRMITPGADRTAYEMEAAAREARIGTPSEFSSPRTAENVPTDVRTILNKPEGRRTEDDAKRLAQWEASTQGKNMGGVGGITAEPQTQADRLALEAQELENERKKQIIEAARQPDATTYDKKAASLLKGVEAGTITQAQADEALKRELIGNPPAGYNTWAEYEAETGVDADGDGRVSTSAEASAASPKGVAANVPEVGTIKSGYRFKGGDPSKKTNWEKV